MNSVPISFNIDCEHLPFTQFSVGTFLTTQKTRVKRAEATQSSCVGASSLNL